MGVADGSGSGVQILEILLNDPRQASAGEDDRKMPAVANGAGGIVAGGTCGAQAAVGNSTALMTPAGRQGVAFLYKKKSKYNSPVATMSPGSPGTPRTAYGLHIVTLATYLFRQILLLITGKDGKAGYCMPLIRYLVCPTNAALRAQMKIHEIFKRRDPNDPTKELTDPPKRIGGYEPPYHILMVQVNNPIKNTLENRTKIANAVCTVNNSRVVQVDGYGNNPGKPNNNNMMAYQGDISPADPNNLPKLSDYITIGDVMSVIKELLSSPEGQELTDVQVVQNQAMLDQFFSPDLHAKVRELYQEGAEGGAFAPGFIVPQMDLD